MAISSSAVAQQPLTGENVINVNEKPLMASAYGGGVALAHHGMAKTCSSAVARSRTLWHRKIAENGINNKQTACISA